MGKQYKSLTNNDITFIQKQKLFYIASCSDHEVNLSPKGYDSIYIINDSSFYMMDYLGSGNRTARDISQDGELTLVFNAFEGEPKILRCFCTGKIISKTDEEFKECCQKFSEDPQAIRQFFKLHIYTVESSCGMGVPIMTYKEERSEVRDYAISMAKSGEFEKYVQDHKTPPTLNKPKTL